MNGFETFSVHIDYPNMEIGMTRAEQIEQLALGELSPEEGAKLVRLMAAKEELHEELYLALRSCVW